MKKIYTNQKQFFSAVAIFLSLLSFVITFFNINIQHVEAASSPLSLVSECTHGPILNASTGEHECDFVDFIQGVQHLMNYAFYLSIPLAVIAFTYAGVKLLFAQGNSSKISEVKRIFYSVGIGFIFIMMAWLLVYTLAKSLGCTNCLQFIQH